MCTEWLYEAIDQEVSVEMNRGDVVRGILRNIDASMNLTVELPNHTTKVLASLAISLIVLPSPS
ncbi:hypothetical protein NEDG_01406 [Nematocida displodere]|uniref:Sm domain-containing protein n=1 Tax=Nematocida displodere TaxID=1805483 RepID=A0A177EBK3_9MICR|nr:hypothetical protein NEDG_01406 [Nematocida displodere]